MSHKAGEPMQVVVCKTVGGAEPIMRAMADRDGAVRIPVDDLLKMMRTFDEYAALLKKYQDAAKVIHEVYCEEAPSGGILSRLCSLRAESKALLERKM